MPKGVFEHVRRPIAERFWVKVRKTEECWIWTGCRHEFGYGKLGAENWRKAPLYAHRISWELHYGPVPLGMWVLHRCDNPPCVRPDHLFLGDCAANVADMCAKGRGVRREQHARGERHASARLTEASVRELRVAYERGECRRSLAKRFGISLVAVRLAAIGKTWAHVQ